MYLTDQNDMESFVPDENFLFSAALGWAVASVAFQASFLVENGPWQVVDLGKGRIAVEREPKNEEWKGWKGIS